jgi:nucleolar protein 53
MRKIDITAEVAAVRAEEEEVKLHGGKLAAKEDGDLFKIDTGAMDTTEMVAQVKLSKKDRYRNKTNMLDKILSPPTNIKPLHQARSHSNKAEEYQQRFLARQNCGEKPLVFKHAEKTGKYDLWDEKSRAETFEVNLPVRVDGKGKGHGTKKYTNEKNQMTTRQQLKKLGKEAHKMEAPHAGQSYKPTDSDHQDLLRSEHHKIVTEKEKADKLDRQVAWDKTTAATYESDLVEVQQGLFEEDTGIVSEDEDDTMIEAEKIDDGMPKKKSARNRWLADMEKQKKAKEEKAKRHQEAQVYNGKRFLREAAEEDVAIAKRKGEREEAWNNKMPRFRTKYEEPAEELKLTEEMKPTLRELVPEGGILKDRYQSLVRRAVIAPHSEHKGKYKRKFKVKLQVKRSVKKVMGDQL